MLWIKNTKAWMLLRGIIMLGLFILLAWIFQMHTILFLAGQCISVLATAAVVVFQPELRRMLEKLGSKNVREILSVKEEQREIDRVIEQTVQACEIMSRERVGVLLIFERETPLELGFDQVEKLEQ